MAQSTITVISGRRQRETKRDRLDGQRQRQTDRQAKTHTVLEPLWRSVLKVVGNAEVVKGKDDNPGLVLSTVTNLAPPPTPLHHIPHSWS